jgi:hypothetical protein
MEIEGPRKRSCVSQDTSDASKHVPIWRRMVSKLRIREHWLMVWSVMSSLMMPAIQLWSHLLMQTSHAEELESLEEMSDLVQVAVMEKKEQMKTQANLKKQDKAERRNKLQKQLRGQGYAHSETSQSFILIPDSPKAVTLRMENMMSQSVPANMKNQELDLHQLCFCGLPCKTYTCRQQGANYGRTFLRCPQTPNTPAQCHFFMWLESTKGLQYETLSNPRSQSGAASSKHGKEHGMSSSHHSKSSSKDKKKKKSRKPSTSSSSSSSSVPARRDHAASSLDHGPSCHHQWSRRGTNSHQEMKTCKHCGERQVLIYKTGEVTRTWVDPAKYK